ncbi:MAG: MFS transporter, partial [Exiguobacterium chiriqhucha]
AYTGSTFLPPLFGLIVSQTSLGLFPLVTVLIMLGMLLNTERLNSIMHQPSKEELT